MRIIVNPSNQPNQPDESGPLLPPWATDAEVESAARTLAHEIDQSYQVADEARKTAKRAGEVLDHQVKNWAPILVTQTESYLWHTAEGW